MINNVDGAAGTSFSQNGKEYLYFGGTSYLGLQTNPEFLTGLKRNIERFGSNFGASRVANLRISVYDEVEKDLAVRTNAEAAVTFSSGYLSGIVLSAFFEKEGYQKVYAPGTHGALHLPGSINLTNHQQIAKEVDQILKNGLQPVIFMDTMDFSGRNYPEFDFLKKLSLKDCILVADDSHGFGIVGENGFGVFNKLQDFQPKELLVCGSLGKALATPAGVVLGSKSRIEKIRNTSIFGGASPASPAALSNFIETESLQVKQLQKLRSNIAFFKKEVTSNFKYIDLYQHPVFTYNDEELTRFLNERNIMPTSFRYPDEQSPIISKIVISAAHSEEQISALIQCVNQFYS